MLVFTQQSCSSSSEVSPSGRSCQVQLNALKEGFTSGCQLERSELLTSSWGLSVHVPQSRSSNTAAAGHPACAEPAGMLTESASWMEAASWFECAGAIAWNLGCGCVTLRSQSSGKTTTPLTSTALVKHY